MCMSEHTRTTSVAAYASMFVCTYVCVCVYQYACVLLDTFNEYVCLFVCIVHGCLCSHLLGSACDRVYRFTWCLTLLQRNVLVTVGYIADIMCLATSKMCKCVLTYSYRL